MSNYSHDTKWKSIYAKLKLVAYNPHEGEPISVKVSPSPEADIGTPWSTPNQILGDMPELTDPAKHEKALAQSLINMHEAFRAGVKGARPLMDEESIWLRDYLASSQA